MFAPQEGDGKRRKGWKLWGNPDPPPHLSHPPYFLSEELETAGNRVTSVWCQETVAEDSFRRDLRRRRAGFVGLLETELPKWRSSQWRNFPGYTSGMTSASDSDKTKIRCQSMAQPYP